MIRLTPLYCRPGAPPTRCPCCRDEDATHVLTLAGGEHSPRRRKLGPRCIRRIVEEGLRALDGGGGESILRSA